MNSSKLTRPFVAGLLSLILLAAVSFGQSVYQNGGVLRNTGTLTVKSFQNFTTTAGTVLNGNTINVGTTGGSGVFFNTDTSSLNGVVHNYLGTAGTIHIVGTLHNNHAGAIFDNDSLNTGSVLILGADVTSAAGTFDTDSAKVVYNSAGAQSVFPTSYGSLVADGGSTKTLPSGTTTVNDSLRIDNSTTLAVASNTLVLNGALNTSQNSGALSAGTGTVEYNGDLDQSVIPAQYKTLSFAAASSTPRKKTANGTISFAASGALTIGAHDTLFVSSGDLDLSSASTTLSNSATGSAVKVAGNVTFNAGIPDAGTFYYDGSSAQSIGASTYADLILGNGGGKTFPNGGTVAVKGNYTINPDAGTRSYTGNTFQFAGATAPQTISNLAEGFHILQFAGAATKTLGGSSFTADQIDLNSGTGLVTNNVTTVTIAGNGGVAMTIASLTEFVNSASSSITMSGNLQNDGILSNAGSITVN